MTNDRGRPVEPYCYRDGKVDYDRVKETAAFEVARDYRQLLVIYNRAAKIGNQAGGSYYIFDEVLASRVSNFSGRFFHRIVGWLF